MRLRASLTLINHVSSPKQTHFIRFRHSFCNRLVLVSIFLPARHQWYFCWFLLQVVGSGASGATAGSFCRRVTLEEYEEEGQRLARESLTHLLDTIIADVNMNAKTKKKRLKQVRTSFARPFMSLCNVNVHVHGVFMHFFSVPYCTPRHLRATLPVVLLQQSERLRPVRTPSSAARPTGSHDLDLLSPADPLQEFAHLNNSQTNSSDLQPKISTQNCKRDKIFELFSQYKVID